MVLDLRVGDVLRMRRPHPCGGLDWDVVRVGADIGLVCRACRRRVLMRRDVVRRRARALVERGAPVDPAVWRALEGGEPPSSAGDPPLAPQDDPRESTGPLR